MNKQELIDQIANATGETKRTVGAVIESLTETITDTLQSGGEVELRGIGKFSVATKAARTGRNPTTGASIQLPERKAPKFKVSTTLKSAVNK